MRGKNDLTISADATKQAVASIKRYFQENMDEEIGDLKAGILIDYFLEELGPTVYNQAIADARSFFEERTADLGGICYQAEFPFWGRRKRSS